MFEITLGAKGKRQTSDSSKQFQKLGKNYRVGIMSSEQQVKAKILPPGTT